MTASLAFSLAVLAGISLRGRPSAAPRENVLRRLRGGQSEETWDYVIVGGGAAGCVLAERLSADPECRVLVLEAGTDGSRDMRIRIPAGLVKVFKSERDWDFETEPVRGTNRGVYLCRGKVLGGSSSTNVMLYHRGSPADYDSWVQQGAVGWGPSEVLDYYRRAERNVDGPSQYHGTVRQTKKPRTPHDAWDHRARATTPAPAPPPDSRRLHAPPAPQEGPMPVDNVPYINELSSAFLAAAGNLGYRHNRTPPHSAREAASAARAPPRRSTRSSRPVEAAVAVPPPL